MVAIGSLQQIIVFASLCLLTLISISLIASSDCVKNSAYADVAVNFNPSEHYPCFEPCSYNVTIADHTYPIEYQVWNESGNTTALARLDKITANSEQKSLLIDVTSDNNGTLILYIPKNVLNTSVDGAPFTLLINGEIAHYEQAYEPQWATEFSYRQLEFRMDRNTKEIAIIGQQMIPEFGSIAIAITGIAIVGVVVAARKSYG